MIVFKVVRDTAYLKVSCQITHGLPLVDARLLTVGESKRSIMQRFVPEGYRARRERPAELAATHETADMRHKQRRAL